MICHAPRLASALPMPEGLLAWTRTQGPDMWHEIACGIDFTDPQATIDLLLTTQWIVRQEGCCRATAVLLLARMVGAGLHLGAPAHLAPPAGALVARELHRRLAEGRFPVARYRLSAGQQALIQALFGATGPMPLPAAVLRPGRRAAHPPHVFLGWRPCWAPQPLRLVA